ncbi:MAG TPA: hybrid sensor histidine kinase/response regulator, partial [Polyangiales bacterium]|nr:hybrid sensor histidine kinase/response regulator [Polyangiales bacterium]
TGSGIAPEVLPHVFELFEQERQGLDRARGGLGLGLAIVRSLVQLHHGEVIALSQGRGSGAELIVRLPSPVPRSDDAAREAAEHDDGAAEHAQRVLVVDDNADTATLLIDVLSARGYVARAAYDAPTALRIAESFDPDVAVLDLGLPVMDGFELARRFIEHPQLRRTRLVALTGYGRARDRELTAQAGFLAHLLKPVDLDELGSVLERVVGTH